MNICHFISPVMVMSLVMFIGDLDANKTFGNRAAEVIDKALRDQEGAFAAGFVVGCVGGVALQPSDTGRWLVKQAVFKLNPVVRTPAMVIGYYAISGGNYKGAMIAGLTDLVLNKAIEGAYYYGKEVKLVQKFKGNASEWSKDEEFWRGMTTAIISLGVATYYSRDVKQP